MWQQPHLAAEVSRKPTVLAFEKLRTVACGGLNENVPHRLMYLYIWSSIGGTVWGRFRGVVLLKEVCHTVLAQQQRITTTATEGTNTFFL